MNKKVRDYILENWQKYNLTDTKKEFIALVNILEPADLTIDDLHDVVFNGHDEFFDIVDIGNYWQTDRDVVESVTSTASFYTVDEFAERLTEELENAKKYDETHEDGDEVDYFYRQYFTDEWFDTVITQTTDGYVIRVYC